MPKKTADVTTASTTTSNTRLMKVQGHIVRVDVSREISTGSMRERFGYHTLRHSSNNCSKVKRSDGPGLVISGHVGTPELEHL